MLWYVIIWSNTDMIYNMIKYYIVCCDTIRYEVRYDMIRDRMVQYDVIWYGMISCYHKSSWWLHLVDEDIGTFSIPVLRRVGMYGQVSVNYITRSFTAQSGSDYILPNGTITFRHGQNVSHINVSIVDDLDRWVRFGLKLYCVGIKISICSSFKMDVIPHILFEWKQMKSDEIELFTFFFTGNIVKCLKSSSSQPQEEQYWALDSLLRLSLLKATRPVEWFGLSIRAWSPSQTLTAHWGSALFWSASEGWWAMPRWAASRYWLHNLINCTLHMYSTFREMILKTLSLMFPLLYTFSIVILGVRD